MKSRGSKLQVGARAEARGSHQQVNQPLCACNFLDTKLSNYRTGLQKKKRCQFVAWPRNIESPTQPSTRELIIG